MTWRTRRMKEFSHDVTLDSQKKKGSLPSVYRKCMLCLEACQCYLFLTSRVYPEDNKRKIGLQFELENAAHSMKSDKIASEGGKLEGKEEKNEGTFLIV